MKIALAGNPNCGKTLLFNILTGSNQYVGNWPGVTVEKKEGIYKKDPDITVVDLPGVYSLSPYTPEEIVARRFLTEERPDAILNVVDGTNLERNLYLSTQLSELGIPTVIAVNMMDMVKKAGDSIDLQYLSKKFGCAAVEISALKNIGIDLAMETVIEKAKNGCVIPQHRFSGEVEHALAHIEEAAIHSMPDEQQRWYAIKIFERDSSVIEKLKIPQDVLSHIEFDIRHAEEEFDDDAESIITNERYNYITAITEKCFHKKNKDGLSQSYKIDRILTNKYLALPIFALIMLIVYYLSISGIGGFFSKFLETGIFGEGFSLFGKFIPGVPILLEKFLTSINCALWLKELIIDGILAGVGGILSFTPQMFMLFFFLSILEDCGYMSRIAFLMDKLFRHFGLSGQSFIPILVGTGCSVPGIMASRTIKNESDRRMTIITTSFIPCGAKLPVIWLLASTFFLKKSWIVLSAYLVGIASVLLSGLILKKTKLFSQEITPFVMELPNYHMPTAKNVLRSSGERTLSFVKKAGTVILVSSAVLWTMQRLGFENGSFGLVESIDNSVLAKLGSILAVIFKPLGFGRWESVVASLTGLIAKENIVSTFSVILGSVSELPRLFTPLSACTFLIFNLLCAPCVAAMNAIRKEMNSGKWTAFAIFYQCTFAYCVSLMIYQFGSALSGDFNPLSLTFAVLILVFGIYFEFFKKKKEIIK